jgi:hypothetical protein
MESVTLGVHDARKSWKHDKGVHMAHQHLIQARQSTNANALTVDVSVLRERTASKPLRFAVSLTDPQGRMLFRKQFASSIEADGFAMATAELCPEYKVSSVDRVGGIAYEVMGHSLTITASTAPDSNPGSDEVEHSSA